MSVFLVRVIYLPLFLIGGNAAGLYLVAEGASLFWLLPVGLFFILFSVWAERLAPYDRAFNLPQGDTRRDIIHAVVNETLSVAGVATLPFLALVFERPTLWPTDLPLWLQLLFAVLIADVGITLAHFASHRVQALWRLHAVHHSVRRMYGMNGLMKHPLHQYIETTAGATPLLLLGAPQEIMALLVLAVVLQLLLQHSNVAYFTGPFKYLLAINVIHRFHHLNNAEEGDVNFGLFTTMTDRVLGTAYYDKAKVIGVDNLGIAEQPNYPKGYMRQLFQPFRSQQAS